MERNVTRELIADISSDLELKMASCQERFLTGRRRPTDTGNALLTSLREKQLDLRQTLHVISNNKRNYLPEMKICRSPCECDCSRNL